MMIAGRRVLDDMLIPAERLIGETLVGVEEIRKVELGKPERNLILFHLESGEIFEMSHDQVGDEEIYFSSGDCHYDRAFNWKKMIGIRMNNVYFKHDIDFKHDFRNVMTICYSTEDWYEPGCISIWWKCNDKKIDSSKAITFKLKFFEKEDK